MFESTSVTARLMLLLILLRWRGILLREYFAISLFVLPVVVTILNTVSFSVRKHHVLRYSLSLTLTVHTTFIPINNLIILLGCLNLSRHLSSRINVQTQSRLSFICTQMYAILIGFLLIIAVVYLVDCVIRKFYERLAAAWVSS